MNLFYRYLFASMLFQSALPETLGAQDIWLKHDLPQGGAVEHVVVTPDGDIFAQIAFKGMYRSTDLGFGWNNVDFPVLILSDFVSDKYGVLYATSAAGSASLWRSTDNAGSWNKNQHSYRFREVDFSSTGRTFFLTETSGIVWSDNAGDSITETSLNVGLSQLHITRDGHVFVYHFDKLYRSIDNGITWVSIYENISGIYQCLSLTSDPAGNLYCGVARYLGGPMLDYFILRSTDNGDTWSDTNLPAPWYLPSMMVSTAPGDVICLTSDAYVIRTTNYGETWENYFSGMNHNYGYDLTLTPDGRAVIGSVGCIYITSKPVGVEQIVELPSSLSLAQSYPNPVVTGQSAYINFSLPTQEYITLTVYNTVGQEVAQIAQGTYPPGTHTAMFASGNLPTGVYIYRLVAGTSQESRVLQVLR